jgi:hypothetical protein
MIGSYGFIRDLERRIAAEGPSFEAHAANRARSSAETRARTVCAIPAA